MDGFQREVAVKKACIIPAYNEELTVGNVLRTALAFPDFNEVYLVDDGSIDGTGEQAANYEKHYGHLKIIRNSVNIGKTRSVINTIKLTDADLIVLLDADLLNLTVAEFYKLIDPVENGEYNMTILDRWASDRGNLLHGWSGMVRIFSGERAFKKSDFRRVDFSSFVDHPYILENVMNLSFLEMGLKVKNISAPSLFAVSRRRKRYTVRPISNYLKMVMVFIRYIGIKDLLRQALYIETDLLPLSMKRTIPVFLVEIAYSATVLFPVNWVLNQVHKQRIHPSG